MAGLEAVWCGVACIAHDEQALQCISGSSFVLAGKPQAALRVELAAVIDLCRMLEHNTSAAVYIGSDIAVKSLWGQRRTCDNSDLVGRALAPKSVQADAPACISFLC